MKTRIRIDPNIRVRGNHTLAESQDVEGPLVVGEAVEVYEPEADIVGTGRVVEIDDDRDLIVLAVDWPSMRLRQVAEQPATRPAVDVIMVLDRGWKVTVARHSKATAATAPDLARVG